MASKKAVQVVPTEEDYVIQSHDISRAAYSMPVLERRLLYLAMAQVRPDDEEPSKIEMKTVDVAKALGMTDDKGEVRGKDYTSIREAAAGLRGQVLNLDTPFGWIITGWVHTATWIKSRDVIQLKLSDDVMPFAWELQSFGILQVRDLAKLQGQYSQRLFELVMSWKGMSGKGGNKPGTWFVDAEFATLRARYKIQPQQYKATNDLRKRIIDDPVREINEANIGIRIDCDYDYFRHGRKLLGVRLKVKETKPGEPRPVTPATKAEKEELDLIALNPELWEKLLSEEPNDLFGGQMARIGNAYKRLEAHPDLKKPTPKRSKKL